MSLRICPLLSGSSGNATLISSEKTALLIDAGAPAREIVTRLRKVGVDPRQIHGVLLTHSHADHYRAAGTLHAQYGLPIYIDRSAARALRRKAMRTSWRRVRETRPIPEQLGDLEIECLDTPHGLVEEDGRTVAFQIRHGSRRAAVVTDLGEFTRDHLEALRGVDAIVLEANYDEESLRRKLSDYQFQKSWSYLRWSLGPRGHLSNTACAEALLEILPSSHAHVYLGHLSENHKRPEFDNNSFATARATVENVFKDAGRSLPQIHRAHRLGRDAAPISDIVELG